MSILRTRRLIVNSTCEQRSMGWITWNDYRAAGEAHRFRRLYPLQSGVICHLHSKGLYLRAYTAWLRATTPCIDLISSSVAGAFQHSDGSPAAEDVLLWAAGTGDADAADDHDAVDDRNSAACQQDAAAMRDGEAT
jgi:hypothetical protein